MLAGLVAVPFLARSFQLLQWLPIGKPPAVLEDRAREFVRSIGVADAPADDAWGLALDYGFVNHVREKDSSVGRWEVLSKGTPPVLQFWYRQSPRPIVSWLPGGRVYWAKPGLDVTDMAGVIYDMSGRLLRFYAIPPQLESDPAGCSRSRPSARPRVGRGCAAPSRATQPPGPEPGLGAPSFALARFTATILPERMSVLGRDPLAPVLSQKPDQVTALVRLSARLEG